MRKTVVINAVGLTESLIGPFTPRLARFAQDGAKSTIGPVLPAVTTTVQSTYLTGAWPGEHGIVGNGWYFRDECEVKFWRQSNRLVQRPKLWEMARARDRAFTCANLFWWYNMYSSVDVAVTPRPMYPADGRKIPDVWAWPLDIRHRLQAELGQFPLFKFWGPDTSIRATQWIADSALLVDQWFHPTLTLIYLPHLDYCLQRLGPHPDAVQHDLRDLDAVCGRLIDYYTAQGAQIIILSEYGIVPVARPIHVNRILRKAGLLAVREELGHEILDAGASAAFAVADHQVAHVYVNDPSKLSLVRSLMEAAPGMGRILDDAGKKEMHLDHPRSGELVCLAEPDAWFTYYFWLDEKKAPDYARTVDIHRKPGYDPVELFFDPAVTAPRVKAASIVLLRKLGFRALMKVISTDASLVKGSHGLASPSPKQGPLLITSDRNSPLSGCIEATDVRGLILQHIFG